MHCDFLDFLSVNPPSKSKISIFRDIVDGIAFLHSEKKVAHNDLRLPNLFLRKKFGKNSHNSSGSGLNFEGEEFYCLEGVLGDFGLAGDNCNQIFKKMTSENLSPEALDYKLNNQKSQ